MLLFGGGVLQGGLFVLVVVAFTMVAGLQIWHTRLTRRVEYAPDDFGKASLFEHKIAFEVKLTMLAALLFLYPLMLTALMVSKPTYYYWCGPWLLALIIAVPAWVALCHVSVARGWISRIKSPLVVIMVPAAVLALMYQLHWWRFGGEGVALISDDCQSFQGKAELEASWQEANRILQACAVNMSKLTSSPLRQTALVTQPGECEGYSSALAVHGQDWAYLASLEKDYRCGGWCKPAAPLWYAQALPQDSCSKAAARVMIDGIGMMMRQLSAYSSMLIVVGFLALFLGPNWLKE